MRRTFSENLETYKGIAESKIETERDDSRDVLDDEELAERVREIENATRWATKRVRWTGLSRHGNLI